MCLYSKLEPFDLQPGEEENSLVGWKFFSPTDNQSTLKSPFLGIPITKGKWTASKYSEPIAFDSGIGRYNAGFHAFASRHDAILGLKIVISKGTVWLWEDNLVLARILCRNVGTFGLDATFMVRTFVCRDIKVTHTMRIPKRLNLFPYVTGCLIERDALLKNSAIHNLRWTLEKNHTGRWTCTKKLYREA